MTNAFARPTEPGFSQTCWRGICFCHPREWEPAILSGLNEPARCTLVDRRYQRMQLHWEVHNRPPDLARMYEQLRQTHHAPDRPVRPLDGSGGWTGLIRSEAGGHIVHAGKYFDDTRCLVQVVFTWPGGRERRLEGAILQSIRPQPDADPAPWEALGLRALVPAAFRLVSADHQVGRIRWEFRRSGRPAAGLTLERIGMRRYWLKASPAEWLVSQQPKGSSISRHGPVDCAGHDGTEVVSRKGGLLAALAGRTEHQLDRAWVCPTQERVYRLTYRQRSGSELDWPEGVEVHCCRRVRMRPAMR